VGQPIRFGNASAVHLNPVPLFGQNSVAILRELGKSRTEIDALLDGKIVKDAGQDIPRRFAPATSR